MQDILEKVLGGIAANGWDGIERAGVEAGKASKRQAEEMRAREMEEAKIVKAALSTPAGQQFLMLLVKKTLIRSETVEEKIAATAERYAILKAQREGQRNLVFMVLNMLRIADGEDPQPGGDL